MSKTHKNDLFVPSKTFTRITKSFLRVNKYIVHTKLEKKLVNLQIKKN